MTGSADPRHRSSVAEGRGDRHGFFSVPIAFATAWILARKEFYGKSILQALITLPLVMPPVVTGYLLLVVFGRNGILGHSLHSVGFELAFQWTGAALAAGVMGLFPCWFRADALVHRDA